MTAEKPVLTKSFLETHRAVFFHPATPDEAVFIQERLFEMGFVWVSDKAPRLRYAEELASGTLILNCNELNGAISRMGRTMIKDGILCDVTQFEEKYIRPSTFEEKINLRFNELSEKVDRLTRILEKMESELLPDRSIDKPSLKSIGQP